MLLSNMSNTKKTLMAKKQFTNSFQDIFSPTETPLLNEVILKTQEDKEDKIQRTTLLLSRQTYKTIKAIAYWERKQIKEIIHEAIVTYLNTVDADELEKAIAQFEDDINGGC
jgi:endonuclease III